MLLEGTCHCKKCKKEFEWYNIVPQLVYGTGQYQVHAIPGNKEPIQQVLERDSNQIPTKVASYCSYCDYLNTFNV